MSGEKDVWAGAELIVRKDERAAIVRWLRDMSSKGAPAMFTREEGPCSACMELADAIERGEHEP